MANASASLSLNDCTCQICRKILHKPILISCECKSSICQEHLSDIFRNEDKAALFECKKCKIKLNLVRGDLKENTQLNIGLESFNYLGRSKQKLKSILEAKLAEIENYILNVKEVEIAEYSEKIYDHFYLLRNEIDIKRETVLQKNFKTEESNTEEIEEINCQSSYLIEQIDLTENEFRKRFMEEITFKINEISIDEKRKHLDEMLRDASLSENEMEKLINTYESQMAQMQFDFTLIDKNFVARLKVNRFKEFDLNVETAKKSKN